MKRHVQPIEDVAPIAGGRGKNATTWSSHWGEGLRFRFGKHLPVILQAESGECGLACLAMIAGYYGHHADLSTLRLRFAQSLKGVTARRIIDMAQVLGLQSRALRLDMRELSQLQTPCLLHWDLDHFVVLKGVCRNQITIHDPAVGVRTLNLLDVSSHFTGVALEFSKGPTFQRKRADPPVSLRALAGSVKGLGKGLSTLFGLALVLELFALLAPLLTQMVVDQVLADGDHDLLMLLAESFLLLLFLQIAVSALRTWTVMWLSSYFNLALTGNVFQHLLRLPQLYFLTRHLGDIVSRFGAISAIQQTLTTRFVEIVLDGLMASITLVMLFVYSPILSSVTIIAVAIYGASRFLYLRIYREANLSQILVNAKQQSSFLETIRGIQTLRLYNLEATQTSRYLNTVTASLNTSIAVQRLDLLFGSLNGLSAGVQRIVVLCVGAYLVLGSQFTVGMLLAFVAYADQFTSRAASLIDYIIELRILRLQAERLADIVLTPPEKHTDSAYVGPEPEAGVSFHKVNFRYAEGEPWILHDCSFSVKPGESVAIVGSSGCGKSTLARLLLGLLDPQQGVIEVGGIDLRRLGKSAFRAMTASIMQDDRLFAGSIADNITLFDPSAFPDKIEESARLAHFHGDITAMPMGYHTLIGDMGSALSGGQQQRLLLARALYRQPKILILDEATSHLDVDTERVINGALKALTITRIMIAHRPETIAFADRVIEIVNGKAQFRQHTSARTEPVEA
jgi:ATP-binding cassette, subfamily B, bacterial CvaB/MchF/RaxB